MLWVSGKVNHGDDRRLWQRLLLSEHPASRGRDRRDRELCIPFQEMPRDHHPHMASYYEGVKGNPLVRSRNFLTPHLSMSGSTS